MKKLLLVIVIGLWAGALWAADSDHDGLPDDWELTHGFDSSKTDYAIAISPVTDNYNVYHSCSIARGAVQCSGNNANGQINVPAGITTAYALQLGATYSCALTQTGTVCWGAGAPTSFTPAYPQTVSTTGQYQYFCHGPTFTSVSVNYAVLDPHTVSIHIPNSGLPCGGSYFYGDFQFVTQGTISYIIANYLGVCAMTEFGPECSDHYARVNGSLLPGTFDPDGDGVSDTGDVYPLDASQAGDKDADGIDGLMDNCPKVQNTNQLNTDGDAQGDACDSDDDNDGVLDWLDKFPLDPAESIDTDNDGTGNNADTNDDNDNFLDVVDNCPLTSNNDQMDSDADGIGNACDATPYGPDTDGDGLADALDAFPTEPNATDDTDHDGQPDRLYSQYSDDFEGSTSWGACCRGFNWVEGGGTGYWNIQSTPHHDGIAAAVTSASAQNRYVQFTSTTQRQMKIAVWQRITGGVLTLSVDGVTKQILGFGTTLHTWQETIVTVPAGTHTVRWEYNSFGSGVAAIDNVRLYDTNLTEDTDDDNDGVPDVSDAFPLNAAESLDTDSDGIGNNTDLDDDNDGIPDYIDADPLNAVIHSEKIQSLNGNYKGSLVQDASQKQ